MNSVRSELITVLAPSFTAPVSPGAVLVRVTDPAVLGGLSAKAEHVVEPKLLRLAIVVLLNLDVLPGAMLAVPPAILACNSGAIKDKLSKDDTAESTAVLAAMPVF